MKATNGLWGPTPRLTRPRAPHQHRRVTALRWTVATLFLAGCAHVAEPTTTPVPLLLGADLHAHLVMRDAAEPIFQGRPGEPGPRASSPDERNINQLQLDELRRAGVKVIVASVWTPPALTPWRSPLDEALRQLAALQRWSGRHPEVAIARDADEALRLAGHERIVLIPAVESADGVEHVEDVDRLYAAGARVLQLVHFADDDLAGAAASQLPKAIFGVRSEATNPHGLTPLGRAVVMRMIALGMVIDLAHASDQTITEVLDLAAPAHVPVMFSHAGARALSPGERNLSDVLAARIASGGGIIGVTLSRNFVADVPEPNRFAGLVPGTCDDVVAHWLHFARIVGPDAVTLGSDFNGFITRPRPGGSCPDGIRGTQDLPVLWAALVAHGFPTDALDRGGGRFLEVWKRDEAAADPAARAQAARADGEPTQDR